MKPAIVLGVMLFGAIAVNADDRASDLDFANWVQNCLGYDLQGYSTYQLGKSTETIKKLTDSFVFPKAFESLNITFHIDSLTNPASVYVGTNTTVYSDFKPIIEEFNGSYTITFKEVER